MVGQQAALDSYTCLIHLAAGVLIDSVFGLFAFAAFIKFTVFSMFEMRYLLNVFKAQRPSAFTSDWQLTRSELSMLYLRFYGILMAGFIALYYFSDYALFFVFLV